MTIYSPLKETSWRTIMAFIMVCMGAFCASMYFLIDTYSNSKVWSWLAERIGDNQLSIIGGLIVIANIAASNTRAILYTWPTMILYIGFIAYSFFISIKAIPPLSAIFFVFVAFSIYAWIIAIYSFQRKY